MRTDMVRSYVETLLEQLTGADKAVSDHDGDYPVRYRSARYYVRLVGDDDPLVQVFAVAVDGVEPTGELLAELNEINAGVRFARVFWVRGQVLAETEMIGECLDPRTFSTACSRVGRVADDIGPALAARFGGTTAFQDSQGPDYEPPEPRTGLYL